MSKEDNKKRPKAAALEYKHGNHAVPRLTAKGEGLIAEKIIALAEEHDIPITSDPDLYTLLSKLDIGEYIHPSLYEVVAELLVFIYQIKEEYSGKEKEEDESKSGKDSHKPFSKIDENLF
jgi:flagellar biosynthesis protein